jgi:hypothetical protein
MRQPRSRMDCPRLWRQLRLEVRGMDAANVAKINRLHEKAMRLVDKAFLMEHRLRSLTKTALEAYQLAYGIEAKAARMTPVDCEPTRSVLYRSAASLAIRCGENEDAERLITEGLAGNPPAEIEAELRELSDSLGQKLVKKGVSCDATENGKEAVSGDTC